MASPETSPHSDDGDSGLSYGGGDFFRRPLSPAATFLIVIGSIAGALVLAYAVFMLGKLYRRVRSLIAVHYAELDVVSYPPEGAAYAPDSAYASCAICLVEFAEGERVAKLACGHLFRPGCIRQALRRDPRCPHCRVRILDV